MKKRQRIIIMTLACALAVTGCSEIYPGYQGDKYIELNENEQYIPKTPGIYDSEDTAILVKKDTEERTIQFQNIKTGKRYTLNYDGTTTVLDKYEQPMSLAQLTEGNIVINRFYKETKQLTYMKQEASTLYLAGVNIFSLDMDKGRITAAQTEYELSNKLTVLSENKEVNIMDINQTDILSLWIYNNIVCSINIERGHGYLRLKNDDYFIGGWIEAGQSVITKITEDMLLVVPEGETTVSISRKGTTATQTIDFIRDDEIVWDLSDIEIIMPKTGKINFNLTPVDAKLVIDGKNTSTDKPVELEYGIHQMTVTAEGYKTMAQYIKVAEESADISIEMEKKKDDTNTKTEKTKEEKKENKTESDDAQTPDTEQKTKEEKVTSNSGNYRVYIDSPTDVEVYIDGNYIGIAPVSFAKEPGNYVVTLRKTGCQTRSYTLQVDGEQKDINYSFSDLISLTDL